MRLVSDRDVAGMCGLPPHISAEDLETALRVMRWIRVMATDENPSWMPPIINLCGLLRQFVEIARERETEDEEL